MSEEACLLLEKVDGDFGISYACSAKTRRATSLDLPTTHWDPFHAGTTSQQLRQLRRDDAVRPGLLVLPYGRLLRTRFPAHLVSCSVGPRPAVDSNINTNHAGSVTATLPDRGIG